MIQVAYTNSVCADLWGPFINQHIKHTNGNLPLCMLTDAKDFSDERLKGVFKYSNEDPYYKVWVDGLNYFGEDYFIYSQEDFFLYTDIHNDKIKEYLEFLKNNEQYAYIRLIKSGQLGNVRVNDTLFEIEPTNEDIFSMQATIWRTSDYIKLLETVKDPKWLENSKYRDACIQLNLRGLYHYDDEQKRGTSHWDSNVYPYIATALVRGKWNLGEYPKELKPILNEYNINPNKRGIHI